MTFDLFWVDFFLSERLFGFGLLSIKNGEDIHRSFLAIYWNDREIMIDFLWFRIVTTTCLLFYKGK